MAAVDPAFLRQSVDQFLEADADLNVKLAAKADAQLAFDAAKGAADASGVNRDGKLAVLISILTAAQNPGMPPVTPAAFGAQFALARNA